MKTIEDLIKHAEDVKEELPGIEGGKFKITLPDTDIGTIRDTHTWGTISEPSSGEMIYRAEDVKYETVEGTISIVDLFNAIEDLKSQIETLKMEIELLGR